MNEVHARAKKGMKSLFVRQIFVQVLSAVAGIALARVLSPSNFGLFTIGSFLVTTLALLGDFGLAPSFIQRKNDLTDRDLQVGFTLQQVLTSCVVVILLVAAPKLVALYPHAPPAAIWVVRALAFNLYLTSWRSISALQMERNLRHDQLAWIEAAETLSYQIIAVIMAYHGYGVWSLIWATLVRGVLGTVMAYYVAPWPIRLCYDAILIREILRFGLPFQMGQLINNLSGWITPVFLGLLMGPGAVGYVTWASSNGRKPLMIVESVMRVIFPLFSRFQDDRLEIERILIRYLTYLWFVSGLWVSIILIAGPSLVEWIYTPKWLPAVPALMIFSAAMYFDIVTWVVGLTLASINQNMYVARIMAISQILNIVFALVLVPRLGVAGVALATLLSQGIAAPWMLKKMGQGTFGRILKPLAWLVLPLLGALLVGGVGLTVPLSLHLKAIFLTFTTVSAYGLFGWITGPQWIKANVARQFTYRLRLRNGTAS